MTISTTHDIVPDSPTNVFATLNPLLLRGGTLSDGNLKLSGGGNNTGSFATIPIQKTGKWYVEVRTNDTTDDHAVFLHPSSQVILTSQVTVNGIFLNSYLSAIQIYVGDPYSLLGSVNETATTTGDVLGYLIDIENGEIIVTKNGSHKITITNWTPLDEEYFIAYNVDSTWPACNKTFNFGSDPTFGGLETSASSNTDQNGHGKFLYAPVDSGGNPITDFKSLCTANLPDPAIDPALDDLPEDYFKAVKYTGQTTADAGTWDSVSSTSTIAVGFQPDLVWIKDRDSAYSNYVQDSVRGNTKILVTNSTNGETTGTNTVTSFGSNGFSLGTNAAYNNSVDKFVAWCFRAGGSPTADNTATSGAMNANGSTATSSNSSVSIDGVLQSNYTPAGSPTIYPKRMSVNTKAGFSIVKWLGNNTNNSTIPHGLTKEPDFVIIKNLIDSTVWLVKLNPNTISAVSNEQQYLYLNLPNNFGTNTGEETQITTNTIKFVGNSLNNSNGSGDDMIAYCWHSVAGYSAFGSYASNNSEDGNFIITGFKPAWVMIKAVSGSSNSSYWSWTIYDNIRVPYNTSHSPLYANYAVSENYRGDGTTTTGGNTLYLDFVSNGIKIRNSGTEINGISTTHIYAAFAEQPFKYANAR